MALDRNKPDAAALVGLLVRDVPGGHVDRVMRGPLRRIILGMVFSQMPRYLHRTRASGVHSIVHWRITGRTAGGADVFELEIEGGRCRVKRAVSASEPRVTITVDGAEFVRLATGNSDPMQSYFSGKLTLSGDVMHAAKLIALFRLPRRPS